ncbi:outer dynein arm-docking complex subunit 3-like [Crassostrea angulata]|uniref:ODAD1 central coiled coil region domain-containing protein n=1 Tax=Magallana gigas TaxID=29159 RepID=K1PIB2_MAGGI|nr:coiled-coil domain-containing protein 151 [Crassostrea gigas]XP_052675372.1 outer dynein arm-docking complex subunit 3-like [Crassostrea angulata]|eukprot:XP_011429872.1 PREDICTED: coiled-coil domain-containing protein 151 [Crassostrea gigas]
MPSGAGLLQRPINEQIDELKSKIALLEGDRKAYYETSQFAMKKNRETILKLRKENKEVRKKLSDSLSQDQHVINKAFQDRPVERASMKNKSGRQAITVMDHKVCDTMKRLNALKHQTAQKQKRLEKLQTEYQQMVDDSSEAVATDKGESKDAQSMRYLENSYDKTKLKIDEASHLKRIYEDIKRKLEVEAGNFPSILDCMEAEIRNTKAELKELRAMHDDAHISKEAAQQELAKHEKVVYTERKQREVELQKMKKEAEEKKMQHERIERRIAQRGSIQQDELSPQEKQALQGEEQQQKITTYEEAFKRIKEATGVSDTMEVVRRFEGQDETTKHLEALQKDNEKQITRLKEDKEKLQMEFEEMKYTGDAKLSSGERMLEEFQSHLQKEEDRRSHAEDNLNRNSNIMVSVKAGVEHLSDKLHHLKASKGHVPTAQIAPTSDEYVLDQLSTCEEKLLKLLEELDGKELQEIMKQMEEEEFHASIEGKLPQYNTRIKLPTTQRDMVYDDDEDSGDDDTDVPNRNAIKKQSQFIVDSKTKRRTTKKKKKTK